MKLTRAILAVAVCLGVLLMADDFTVSNPAMWTAKAEARVGRPATPVSYAGVARRTTRRTVAATCATRYDAYGRPIAGC